MKHYNLFCFWGCFLVLALTSCQRNFKKHPGLKTAEAHSILDSLLVSIFEAHDLMGMAIAYMEDDELVYQSYLGQKHAVQGGQIDEQTIFRIASISKSFTAIAVMQLVEQGLLDLDTDVSQYLGWELRHPQFPASMITLRLLMSHKSGIADGDSYYRFSAKMVEEQLAIKELFHADGQYYGPDVFSKHSPGSYFSYTNCSWGIIASIVEIASGQRFDQYCRQHIFKPLNMTASFNGQDIEPLTSMATLYRFDSSAMSWKAQADDIYTNPPSSRTGSSYKIGHNGLLFGPQGSLRASTRDLVLFLQYLIGLYQEKEGLPKIIQRSSLLQLINSEYEYDGQNGDTWNDFFLSYGLGIHRITNTPGGDIIFSDLNMFGHPGIAYGLLSDMYVDLDQGTGIVFITNGSKRRYTYGDSSSFYQLEEDIFDAFQSTIRNNEDIH